MDGIFIVVKLGVIVPYTLQKVTIVFIIITQIFVKINRLLLHITWYAFVCINLFNIINLLPVASKGMNLGLLFQQLKHLLPILERQSNKVSLSIQFEVLSEYSMQITSRFAYLVLLSDLLASHFHTLLCQELDVYKDGSGSGKHLYYAFYDKNSFLLKKFVCHENEIALFKSHLKC